MEMAEGTKTLNFIAEPAKFNTKLLPEPEKPIFVLAGAGLKNRENSSWKFSEDTRYNFSSFEFPNLASLFCDKMISMPGSNTVLVNYDDSRFSEFVSENKASTPEATLIIVVDNSFDILEPSDAVADETWKKAAHDYNFAYQPHRLNFVFIDHHLYETAMGTCPYQSNSDMIYQNFNLIYKLFSRLIRRKQIDKIGVLFHTDLDGVGSGLMIAKILKMVYENIESDQEGSVTDEDLKDIRLAYVLGEYGDISPNKEDVLRDVLDSDQKSETGLMRKFEIMTKNLGRFFKAIRPVVDLKSHIRSGVQGWELEEKYDLFKRTYGIGYSEIHSSYLGIKQFFNDLQNVNDFEISGLISLLAQDPINRTIVEMVQKEIDLLSDGYLRPETPQVDLLVKFLNVKDCPKYKMLVIDSPLDIGRSVMWTYKGRLRYFRDELSSKKFSMANYKAALPYFIAATNNICCYNSFSGKLSLHSDGESAFEIGKAFGGGGHGNIENGSLGSVCVDRETLQKNIEILSLR